MPKDGWAALYRKLSLVNAVVASIWTIILLLRIKPFSYLLPIIADGGPGTWLILGYILYVIVGFCGFLGFSTFFSHLEREGYVVNDKLTTFGVVALFVGSTSATVLLGLGGALGGYARTVQHLPLHQIQAILEPFVDVITSFTILTVVGVLINVAVIARAERAPKGD